MPENNAAEQPQDATNASLEETTIDELDAPSSEVDTSPQEGPIGAPIYGGQRLETRPYLKVFGPDIGVFDYYLPGGSITVGRSEHSDVTLPHHTVSRVHAAIVLDDGEFLLEDANSNYGTYVNNKRISSHVLRHGDSIQISLYVLQFRTHPALPGASAAGEKAKVMLRSKFCLLPSTMRLKYRTLDVPPREIFRTGDTLKVGHGGLLIPTENPPQDTTVLELQLFWPNKQSKRYLGEILGIFPDEATNWMCVKLHSVHKELQKTIVASGNPGPWVDVLAT